MNDTGELVCVGREVALEVDVLPAAPGRLDALLLELGPELGLVVDAEGRPAGVVRRGLRGVEAVEG